MNRSAGSLWTRVKTLAAAAPALFLAIVYFLACRSAEPVLGFEDDWLRRMVLIELFAIHSFPFLGFLALIRPATPEFRGLKWLGVSCLTALYLNAAHIGAGWPGVIAFVSLVGASYLGFLLHWTPAAAAVRLTVRWAMNFTLFSLAAILVSLPAEANVWENRATALHLGILYFTGCGLIELTGFFRLPAWEKIGDETRQQIRDVLGGGPESGRTGPAVFWRAFVPLAGSVLLVAGPIFSAAFLTAVAGHFLKHNFEWPDDDFLMQFWLPVIMTGTLFALRTAHVVWIARVMFPGCERPWWKRPGVIAALAVIGAIYLGAGANFKEDATEVANYRAFVPQIVYASYTGGEGFLALALVPLTWWTITNAARRARQEPRRPDSASMTAGRGRNDPQLGTPGDVVAYEGALDSRHRR